MTDKIAIVGTGLVGRAWSMVFARAGYEVALYDPLDGAAERALDLIDTALPDLERQGLLRGSTAAETRGRLSAAKSLAAALDGAVYMQESAPERLAVKKEIYAEFDRLAGPDTILASSTSAIPASAFTEPLAGRNRCLVAHPINPPHLVPLVELVPAPWTDAEVVDRTRVLMNKVGQAPITLTKEIEGFVANRMQVALFNEAMRLVTDGVCSVADIDTAIAQGIGLRWSFIGPFETGDLNAPDGIRDYCARFREMFYAIGTQQAVPPVWPVAVIDDIDAARRAVLPAEKLAERSQWRDERLTELAVWKAKSGLGT